MESSVILEIGTSQIRLLAGEIRDDGALEISGMCEVKSKGIRKGEIQDRESAIETLREAIKKMEGILRKSIHSVHLVTSAGGVQSKINTGILNLVDADENMEQEINENDISEVTELARRVPLLENRIKLHTLQQYFQVDDTYGVTHPQNMTGSELRLDMLTIHGKRSTVHNFQKLVDDVPIICKDAAFSGLCAALAVLPDEKKQISTLVIDLGAGTTDFVIYSNGFVQTAGSIPVGSEHLTNDISVGLTISAQQAENIKIHDGSALTNRLERERTISIPAQNRFSARMIRAATLNTIISARMEETFSFVKEHIDLHCPNISLSGGVLLTGGGAYLTGIRDLGEKIFNVPCSLGKPFDIHGLPTKDATRFSTLLGGIRYLNSLQVPDKKPSRFKKAFQFIWGGTHE